MGGVSYRVAVAELSPVAPEGGGGRVLGAARRSTRSIVKRCQWWGWSQHRRKSHPHKVSTNISEAIRSMFLERVGGSTPSMVGTVAAPGEGDHRVGEMQ